MPLILRGPGVPAGRTMRGQVSNIDFAPTLLDVANAPGRPHDGRRSLLPTIRNPRRRPDRRSRSRRWRRCSTATSRSTPGTGRTGACAPTATRTSSTTRRASGSSTTAGGTRISSATSPTRRPTRGSRRGWRRKLAKLDRCKGRLLQRQAVRARRSTRCRCSSLRRRGAGGGRQVPLGTAQRALPARSSSCKGAGADRDGDRLEHDRAQRCPAGSVERLRRGALARELGDTAVVLNGPRHFLMDSVTAEGGSRRSFHGLRMRKVATIPIRKLGGPGANALHRPDDRSAAIPGAGTADGWCTSSSHPAATGT